MQALQCCVNILRSLVEWYTRTVTAASLAAAALVVQQSPGVDVVGGDEGAALAGEGGDKEAALLDRWKAYKTDFQSGIALFNKKPKKGIAYMQEHVRSSPLTPFLRAAVPLGGIISLCRCYAPSLVTHIHGTVAVMELRVIPCLLTSALMLLVR